MTEQEIIDNNRIIAEFMGAKPCKQHPNTQLFLTIKDNKNPSLQYWHLLKYHKSWDWLIPVVHKCYKLQYKKGWSKSNCLQYCMSSDYFMVENAIELVYKEIIVFIKWYNENIKK